MQQAARAFQLARKVGVVIGNGSDVGVFTHGSNARELEWMVRLGMTPTEALRAATVVGGQILGKGKELGQLKPGMLADVDCGRWRPDRRYRGDAQGDGFVMKGGKVYRR
jgi:imidazolonepropionase-like amidohydrolase